MFVASIVSGTLKGQDVHGCLNASRARETTLSFAVTVRIDWVNNSPCPRTRKIMHCAIMCLAGTGAPSCRTLSHSHLLLTQRLFLSLFLPLLVCTRGRGTTSCSPSFVFTSYASCGESTGHFMLRGKLTGLSATGIPFTRSTLHLDTMQAPCPTSFWDWITGLRQSSAFTPRYISAGC